jgi:hypothetical protein
MAAQSFPTVTPKVGNYNNAQWVPLMDQRLDPGFFLETFRYGLGSYYFDFMEMANRTINLTTRTPKIFEKLEWENTLKINAAITTGAAGADISIVVHTDDRDAYGNVPIKVGDGIVIPGQNEATGEDRVYVIHTYVAGTYTATASPLSADGNTITESQISVEIAAATTLKIHAYYTGTGTGMPAGKNNYRVQRSYQTQIIKASKVFEGGTQALKWYEVPSETGATSAWFEGQDELELEHRKMCDDALFLGEINDNSTLTEASQAGGTNKRLATKGIWNWGIEKGQELNYAGGAWDFSYLYDYKDLALANNVVSREAMMLMGTDLMREVEQSGLDWISTYSGGSDLFKASDSIGYDVRRILLNGITFQLQEIKSFGNTLRYGNKNYNFTKYGIIIPEGDGMATVGGKDEKHPSFQIGYLNNNGENRTKILGVQDGTTGRTPNGVNLNDLSTTYAQTELAAIVLRPEQLVTIRPE